MKLVRQVKLEFREGSSDKVYEVDLCEVGSDRYVVNFRYGRRGTPLREGTKTVAPQPLAAAERVFADLVDSKRKKGYRDAGTPAPAVAGTAPSPPKPAEGRGRATATLARLRDPHARSTWPLDRAIWRAGELRLREAAQLIAPLIGSGSPLRDYSIAWALGRCGDPNVVPALSRLYERPNLPSHVHRITREALLALADDRVRDEFRSITTAGLPEPLREAVVAEDAAEVTRVLDELLSVPKTAPAHVLEDLYLLEGDHVRAPLLGWLRIAPFAPPYFRALRHIFKTAEFRCDGQVFGILAYRFETERGRFISYRYNPKAIAVRMENRYLYLDRATALLSEDPTTAYGDKTREYLRHRVCRTLARLGEAGDPNFVRMAVGVLLPYSDDDAQPARQSSWYSWQTRQMVTRSWGPFASYLPFNELLYAESRRFERAPKRNAWRFRAGHEPGGPEPAEREEAFQHLWDEQPVGLLHLADESTCHPVHVFVAKALRANPDFLDELDVDALEILLASAYAETASVGFEILIRRYNPLAPDLDLVRLAATSPYDAARQQAETWIIANRQAFLRDAAFLEAIATADYHDTRRVALRLLTGATLADEAASALVGALVAQLLTCDAPRTDLARDLADILAGAFAARIRELPVAIIRDLVTHPLADVQRLGGIAMLELETWTDEALGELVEALVASPHEMVRSLGMQIVARMPEELLLERPAYVVGLLASPSEDVRAAAIRLLERLANPVPEVDVNSLRDGLAQPEAPRLVEEKRAFVVRVSELLITRMLEPEPYEGAHTQLVRALRQHLRGWIPAYSLERALELVRFGTPAAQEIGGVLLAASSSWAYEVSTETLVELARHEVAEVRNAAPILFSKMLFRYRPQEPNGYDELATLTLTLENRWDDARRFWITAFRDFFVGDDPFPPSVLVMICDSTYEDVRALGRELITRHFHDDDGLEYLSKLSEHPSADLQLFATNLLERYAAGDARRLAELRPYFLRVLLRVNQARAAKSRVLDFLDHEARRDEASARVALEILATLRTTIAVGDRGRILQSLVAIGDAWPGLEVPIRRIPLEVRRRAV